MKNINTSYVNLLFNHVKLTNKVLIKKIYFLKPVINTISFVKFSFSILLILITVFYTPIVKPSSSSWLSTVSTSEFHSDDGELHYYVQLTTSSVPHQTEYHSDFNSQYVWFPMFDDDEMYVKIHETHEGDDSRIKSIEVQILSFVTKTELHKTTVPVTHSMSYTSIDAEKFPPSTIVFLRIKIIDYRDKLHEKEIEVYSKTPMEEINEYDPLKYNTWQDRRGKYNGESRRFCSLKLQVTDIYDYRIHSHRSLYVYMDKLHTMAHSSGHNVIPLEPFPDTIVLFDGTKVMEAFSNIISGTHANGCRKDQYCHMLFKPTIKTVKDVSFPNQDTAFEGFVEQTLNRGTIKFFMQGRDGENLTTYYDTRD